VREIVQTSQFKQDLKKIKHSGRYKIADLLSVIESLAGDKPLADKHSQITEDKLILIRTGSHSELF